MKRDIDLQFLLEPAPSKRGWDFKKARKLVSMLKQRRRIEDIAKQVGYSVVGIKAFIMELKRAAKAKYTLNKYFDKGRPLRPGKKVIG